MEFSGKDIKIIMLSIKMTKDNTENILVNEKTI